MHSVIDILVLTVKKGISKKTSNAYEITEAHCVLRDDSGAAGAVGILMIPTPLVPVAKVGLFTASFALKAAAYGESQGRIVAELVGLTPVTQASLRTPKAA